MKLWGTVVLTLFVGAMPIHFIHAQNKSSKAASTPAEPPIAKNWKDSKAALNQLAEKFRDPKLSKEQKVELLPASNNLLYDTQQLKLSKAEKKEQIEVLVKFIAATIETDFANSNTDSLSDDFAANKKTYLAEINKLPNKDTREEILEAFDAWAELAKDNGKSETQGSEKATVDEMEH